MQRRSGGAEASDAPVKRRFPLIVLGLSCLVALFYWGMFRTTDREGQVGRPGDEYAPKKNLAEAPNASGGSQPLRDAPTAPRPHLSGVSVEPTAPVTGDVIRARIADAPDGDTVDRQYVYRWWVNDTLVQEGTDSQLKKPVRRGDKVVVSVSPAEDPSVEVRELVFVGNAPPELSLADQSIAGDRYQAILRVSDPEGDAVKVECRNCPEGMTVRDHRLEWPFGEHRGAFSVTVAATDESGAESLLSYSLTIAER